MDDLSHTHLPTPYLPTHTVGQILLERLEDQLRLQDADLAKIFDGEELEALNRIVNAYIEFAELRALQRKVMTMRDWIAKLDDFLKLSEHELLDHAGKISAEQAKMKAELEYDRYRVFLDSQPRLVDLDFEKAAAELKKLPKQKKPRPPQK
jgi:hypothetical protein